MPQNVAAKVLISDKYVKFGNPRENTGKFLILEYGKIKFENTEKI